MSDPKPITWAEVVEGIAQMHFQIESARESARDAVLYPAEDVPVDRIYIDAYSNLLYATNAIHQRAERLLSRVAEAAPPGESLEAVLAEIVAEGHVTIHLDRSGHSQTWFCGSRKESPGAEGLKGEAWTAATEAGEGQGDTPLAAAVARRDQVRELHAKKASSGLRWVVGIVRVVDEEKAGRPAGDYWVVIDNTDEVQPALHDDEQAARERADHLNADEEAMPAVPGPEEVDGEREATVAREDAARETGASEEGAC